MCFLKRIQKFEFFLCAKPSPSMFDLGAKQYVSSAQQCFLMCFLGSPSWGSALSAVSGGKGKRKGGKDGGGPTCSEARHFFTGFKWLLAQWGTPKSTHIGSRIGFICLETGESYGLLLLDKSKYGMFFAH